MANNKKDFTSIEDLGEYEHELDIADESEAEFSGLQEDEGQNIEPFGGDSLPDLPTEEDEETPSFTTDTSFETADFGAESTFGTDDISAFSVSGLDDGPVKEEMDSEFKLDDSEDEKDEDLIVDMVEETLSTKSPLPSEQFLPPLEEDEPLKESEPAPYIPPADYKAPEEFKDVKTFAESSAFSSVSAEGNPSFSILLKNVRYIEDVNDIVTILRELSLLADSEDQVKGRLMRGHLLIPRISEFAAIFVAHKLRRFDIDIQVGLSDEIHPPKHHEAPELGMVTKHNLYQNQAHHFHFDDPKLEISQIIVAATPTLEGHQVLRYLGVASEHKMLEGNLVEDDGSDEIPRHYQELAQKLKAHALKANANAVVGLNYQLTPLPSEYGIHGHKYRLSCTGNLVWVNKL